MDKKIWIGLIIFLCIISFLYFIWPTPYIYRKSGSFIIRINRITQEAYILTSSGWRPMFKEKSPKQKKEEKLMNIKQEVINKVASDSDIREVLNNPKYETQIKQRLDLFISLIGGEWQAFGFIKRKDVVDFYFAYPTEFVEELFKIKGHWFLESKDPVKEAYDLVKAIYVPESYYLDKQ